jgi:hypothetical protein
MKIDKPLVRQQQVYDQMIKRAQNLGTFPKPPDLRNPSPFQRGGE